MSTLVLADDLTGALEVAVIARQAGVPSRVLLDADAATHAATEGPQLTVVDLRSRDLRSTVAAAVHRDFLSRCSASPDVLVLKKTDSLLRGNIAVELLTLRQRFPQRSIVYVPAYPQMDRWLDGGLLYAKDEHGAIQQIGDLRAKLSAAFHASEITWVHQAEALVEVLSRKPASVAVCEARDQAELESIGAILRDAVAASGQRLASGTDAAASPIIVGPAAIFRCLFPQRGASEQTRLPTVSHAGLGLVGSYHSVSRSQLEALADSRLALVAQAEGKGAASFGDLWQQARASRQWLFLSGYVEDLLSAALDASAPIYLSGGATASAVLLAHGISEIEPIAELSPGLVYSRANLGLQTMHLFTKSGAFGDAHTLVHMIETLQGDNQPA